MANIGISYLDPARPSFNVLVASPRQPTSCYQFLLSIYFSIKKDWPIVDWTVEPLLKANFTQRPWHFFILENQASCKRIYSR